MTDQPAAVRLTSPGEIAAAVPHLCGFGPTESLVAVSLRGERRRIGLTLRVDLPAAEVRAEAAEEVAARLAHDGAVAVALVVFTSEPGDLPQAELVAALTDAVRERDITVMEAVLVRAGRWWSYTCFRPDCCPPEGGPIPAEGAVQQLAAASAYEGRAVLRDRDELVASVAPPVLLAAKAAQQRLDAAWDGWLAGMEQRGAEAMRAGALAALRGALSSSAPPAPALVVSLQDVRVRDEVATWALEDDEALLSLLLALARESVAPYDAPVCTLLALVAWVRGDGALANVALDRALAGDPDYSMARLLRVGLDGQLPPAAVRQWLRETRRSLRPRRRRRRVA